jgi:tetratricopeptide (TPR) repeat protein
MSACLSLLRRAWPALLLALAAAFGLPALAQAVAPSPPAISVDRPLPPPPNWRMPVLVVPGGEGQPIQLREATVDVQLLGGQAQTRVELRLYNPNPRVLEGELQFPLLDGQVVTGFALDVGGRLRDAVPVPKARGQEIFEDIRRRRVDPSLLEATAANQYKLRVYPLPAQGERRVALTFTETLPRQASGAGLLRLPLAFAASTGHLQLTVHANGLARGDAQLLQAPVGTQLQWEAGGMQLLLQRDHWTAPAGPQGWLQLAVRQGAQPQWLVGESAGQRFFAGQLPFKDEPVARPGPKHIALVWDASGSAANQSRVLPILEAYFHSLRQPVKVSLLVVRNRAEAVRTLTVAPDGFAALAKLLRDEPTDGSSNFDNLPIPADADTTIMVTDGLMTDGQRQINYTHSAPVFVLNGAASADLPRLRRLADRTGGALVDTTQMDVVEAVRTLRTDGWRIRSLDSLSARGLVAPSLRVQQDRIALAGELTDSQARLDIVLVHPSGRSRTMAVEIDGRHPEASRWPAQQWAQWRSAELVENPSLHTAELARIAAQHGIVGPNSSLIVLEQAADYARFGLPAPAELVDEVARLTQLQQTQTAQAQRDYLETMVRQFTSRQQWWDKPFPKDTPKPAQPQLQISGGLGAMALRASDASRSGNAAPAVVAQEAAVADRRPSPPTPAMAPAMAKSARADAAGPAAGPAPAAASIALQAWSPDTPYLKRLREVPDAQLYRVYLDERQANAASSAFYLDVAGLFFERGQGDLGLRILSNLAEMNLENRQLLRLYAYRLLQARHPELAIPVFERVSQLAPNEPQSWRDLGLALAEQGEPQRAINALWEVVAHPWNNRFAGINMIALAELNAIAAQQQSQGKALDMSRVDSRLRRNLPLALRVVMAWDTDDTDVDLWVTDPNGEKAFYGHRLTYQGGAMSPDATGGYGPEEFSLKEAKPGKYLVQAQFYGNHQQVLSAGTTVMVRITTGFGRPQAHDEWTSLRLVSGKETAKVADVEVK